MPAPESTDSAQDKHLDARSFVFSRLARQVIRYPDLAIEPFERGELSPREQAFARALEIAVLSRWRTLEAILSTRLKKPWNSLEPKLRSALMGGAAQLLLMDRIPDHAAVGETVDWAKKAIRPGAGALVNGVLRAVIRLREEVLPSDHVSSRSWWDLQNVVPLENGGALLLNEDVFSSQDSAIRMGQQSSICDELIRSWIGADGWECAQRRAHHCLARPPIFLHRADGSSGPWGGSHAELLEILQAEPEARVQDPGSARAVLATKALQPKRIVDFCAGRGTKTKQLANIHPDSEILATDVDTARLADLRTTFEGHSRVRVVRPSELGAVLGSVDLLLLDVPCSNTGVLPRRPEARYRFNAERTSGLARIQKEIVEETTSLLAPGAHLLYVTCSLEPAENTKQAEWIQKRFRVSAVSQAQIEPRGVAGDPPQNYADGGFHALLAPADGDRT